MNAEKIADIKGYYSFQIQNQSSHIKENVNLYVKDILTQVFIATNTHYDCSCYKLF